MRPYIQFSSRNIQKCNEYYLAFQIENDWFAANFHRIEGFSKDFQFEPYKGKVPFIAGIALINNEYIPVIDLKMKLGMNNSLTQFTGRVVIIETEILGNKLKFGIVYESLGDAVEITSKAILSKSRNENQLLNDSIKNIYKHEDQSLIILDLENIISVDDLIDLKTAFPFHRNCKN